MNEEVFQGFLKSGIALCLAMAVFSTLLRWKRFGVSALALGGAFVVFGLLLLGLLSSWPQGWIIAVGVALVVLLALDALLRSNTDTKR